MKKTAGLLAAALLTAVIILFGGCQMFDIFSVDSLIRPPKLTGENAHIQQAFEAAVGKDVNLVNPLFGEYRSAFVFYDFDNDSEEEVFVFYTKNDSPNEIRINILDIDDGNWYSVSDMTGNGSEVYKVDFCDIAPDQYPEMVVTWTFTDSKRNKIMSVYKYADDEGKNFSQILVTQLFDYLILDYDFDGINELLYLFSDTSVQAQIVKASIIKYNADQNTFVPVSEIELSRTIEYPLFCSYDYRRDCYRIYFDCVNFDGTYITEILLFDYNKSVLVRPQDANGNYLCLNTVRNDEIYCEQLKDTLFISIPVKYKYEGSTVYDAENEVSSELYYTQFVTLGDNAFEPESSRYYYDYDDGYKFTLDDYIEDYFMRHNISEHSLEFYSRNKPDELVFTVIFSENYIKGNEKYRVIVYRSTESDPLTVDKIKENISLLQG